jgi:hypothetical protein
LTAVGTATVAGANGIILRIGEGLLTGIHIDPRQPHTVAARFALEQNYPNPFNPSTTIGFGVSGLGSSWVTLAVYDLLGHEVAVLVNEKKEAGYHEVRFDGTGLSSGVYFYRIQAGDFIETRKLLLLK